MSNKIKGKIESGWVGTVLGVFATARKDADAKGLKKGNGGMSTCDCPCGGTIEYAVASYNGHMHLRCEKCGTRMMQ